MSFGDFAYGFKKGMGAFGTGISIIVNSVLLAIVYIVGVGITALFAKIAGKSFLNTSKKKKETYWSELNLKKKPLKNYYRQF